MQYPKPSVQMTFITRCWNTCPRSSANASWGPQWHLVLW